MNRTRLVLPALIALLVLPLVLPLLLPSASAADPLSQKKARAKEIMQQLSVLDAKMEKVVESYNAANARLAQVNGSIKRNQRNLDLARYNLQLAKRQLTERVVNMYKQRPVDMLDVILATKSFSSLVDQLQLLNKVGANDASLVHSIRSYQSDILATRKALAVDQKAAQKLVAQRGAEKARVEGALAQRQSMLKGVKAEISQLQTAQAAAAQRQAQSSGAIVAAARSVGQPNDSSVITFAESFVNKSPYVWGGASPAGFDCSGFTMYVYARFGKGLPHNAEMQRQSVAAVPAGQEQPGDLVFFGIPAYHVGIYIGGGSMVHAPHTGTYVSYGSVAGNSGFGRP